MRGGKRLRSDPDGSLQSTTLSWTTLLKLVPYLVDYKARIGLALLCLIAAKGANVGLPFILKQIVDRLDGLTANSLVVLPLMLLLAYGLLRFANVVFAELRDTLFGRVTEGAMRKIGYRVFMHLHSLDIAYHLERKTGGLSRDIERGVNGISFLLRFMVFNIVPTLIEVGMIVVLLLINYHPLFAIIVLLAVGMYVGFSVIATQWRTRFIRQMNQAESSSSARSVDSLLNFETVKYFNNEDYEAKQYDVSLAVWENARRRNRLSLFALNAGQAMIIAMAMTAALVFAAQQVADSIMTLGDFVLINALMMQIFMPLNFLGFVYREMKGSLINIESMFALLDIKPAVAEQADASELKLAGGAIEFKKVGFYYHSDRPILRNVSFSVAAKSKVAIVGSSGSGKSTILKLLFRFYDAQNGCISIDGQPIKQLTLHSLRQAISIVPQEAVLFNASLFDNIHYGRVSASKQEVYQAIEMAYLSDFVQRLPEKENSLIGERGLKLSGGEKQRVAIARAILKQPSVMVFDEATSSLDSHSEQQILKAMTEIKGHYTSLVIAHRLSTIVDADKIIVLADGEIVETGTHKQLLKQSGRYAQMWRIQQND